MSKITTKDMVLDILKGSCNRYVSGQEIADKVFVTRTAVWKAIKNLEKDGYEIDAVTNKGYRLKQNVYELSRASIEEELIGMGYDDVQNMPLYVYDEVGSTNSIAKRSIEEQYGEEMVIVASSQTSGRGRRGRNFYSPAGTGIYISFVIYPRYDIKKATKVTCVAACALCKAIEDITGIDTSIKWVNDIFVGDKKVAGILTEGITSIESGELTGIVVGIGINVLMPEKGFPKDISQIAGALYKEEPDKNILNQLCAAIIFRFKEYITDIDDKRVLIQYRNRLMLTGHYIKITHFLEGNDQKNNRYALVTGIDSDYHLCVKYDDGTEGIIDSGEVSVVKY